MYLGINSRMLSAFSQWIAVCFYVNEVRSIFSQRGNCTVLLTITETQTLKKFVTEKTLRTLSANKNPCNIAPAATDRRHIGYSLSHSHSITFHNSADGSFTWKHCSVTDVHVAKCFNTLAAKLPRGNSTGLNYYTTFSIMKLSRCSMLICVSYSSSQYFTLVCLLTLHVYRRPWRVKRRSRQYVTTTVWTQ